MIMTVTMKWTLGEPGRSGSGAAWSVSRAWIARCWSWTLVPWLLLGQTAVAGSDVAAGDLEGQSPVTKLRELLRAAPAEREGMLSNRTARQKELIEDGLRRLGDLAADERELRLRVMEMRYYLLPLMKMAPAKREPVLEEIPRGSRSLVVDRLKVWDLLPEALRDEVLEFGGGADYYARLERSTPTQRMGMLEQVPVAQRARVEAKLARWATLGPDERAKLQDRFKQFFDLSETEKNKTLELVAAAEVDWVRRSIQSFEALPPQHREDCLSALEKYSKLTADQRARFLRNAERWRAMPESQREAWREVMTRVPPMPPVDRLPPLPPVRPSLDVPAIPGGRE